MERCQFEMTPNSGFQGIPGQTGTPCQWRGFHSSCYKSTNRENDFETINLKQKNYSSQFKARKGEEKLPSVSIIGECTPFHRTYLGHMCCRIMHAGPLLHFLQRHDSLADLLTAAVFHNSFTVIFWSHAGSSKCISSKLWHQNEAGQRLLDNDLDGVFFPVLCLSQAKLFFVKPFFKIHPLGSVRLLS